MNRGQAALNHDNPRSMVIDDLDIESVALGETKAHSQLLVDSYGPLAFAKRHDGTVRRSEAAFAMPSIDPTSFVQRATIPAWC